MATFLIIFAHRTLRWYVDYLWWRIRFHTYVLMPFKSVPGMVYNIYRIAGKFGGLAVCVSTAKLKSTKCFMHVCMAIPYHAAKFKSTNGVKNVVLGQTAKFNDRQYFWLYGIQSEILSSLFYYAL